MACYEGISKCQGKCKEVRSFYTACNPQEQIIKCRNFINDLMLKILEDDTTDT